MNPNDLLGVEVEHNLLGKGIITKIENNALSIQFSKRFQFPESLITGPLKIVDADLRSIILDELDKLVEQERYQESVSVPDAVHNTNHVEAHAINHVVYERFKYRDWCQAFPYHVVVQKEGFMYAAHYESADILNRILGYQLFIDYYGRLTTGGPDESIIARRLEDYNVSYIIVEGGCVIDGIDAADPFKKFEVLRIAPWEKGY